MKKREKPLVGADGEVRALTRKDFERAVGFDELPVTVRRAVGQRGPQRSPKKVPVTIRLSAEVVDAFKAQGRGWQGRIDEVLRLSVMRVNGNRGARKKSAAA